MDTPLPSTDIYQLKVFLWVVSIIILALGTVSLWFLNRLINSQDSFNVKVEEELKEKSSGISILTNDLFEMTNSLNSEIYRIRKDVDDFGHAFKNVSVKSDKIILFLSKINKDISALKQTIEQHDKDIHDIIIKLSRGDYD